jgi:transposase
MLSITNVHRCYLYRGRTDMRKGVDGLSGLIRNELGKDPLSGELFVFFNRTHSLVKLLLWDHDGFALYQKRLERGTFELPAGDVLHTSITAQQLNLILAGVSLKTVKLRPRYRHAQSASAEQNNIAAA